MSLKREIRTEESGRSQMLLKSAVENVETLLVTRATGERLYNTGRPFDR